MTNPTVTLTAATLWEKLCLAFVRMETYKSAEGEVDYKMLSNCLFIFRIQQYKKPDCGFSNPAVN